MQHQTRRIFQWFSFGLLTATLLPCCWLAFLFIRYPASQQQLIFGSLLLVLCAISLGSLAWWVVKRRRHSQPLEYRMSPGAVPKP